MNEHLEAAVEKMNSYQVWPAEHILVHRLRQRVNVTTSVKGVLTWECTVDGDGFTQDEILALSDNLVAALRERYPAPTN